MADTLLILIFTCFINLALGSLIYLRNPKAKSSIAFIAISILISLWAVSNNLTSANVGLPLNNIFNKLAFSSAYFAIFAAAIFSYNFPTSRSIGKKTKATLTFLTVSVGILSFTNLISGTVSNINDQLHFSIGPLLFFYIGAILVLTSIIIRNLVLTMKFSKDEAKLQARFIMVGFILTILLGLLMNVIIPIIVSNWQSADFGPLLTVIFVGTITYAIVRHRLFDIRLIVVRTLGYVTAVVVLASLYGFLVFGIAQWLFGLHFAIRVQIFISASTAIAGLAFQKIRLFFDQITNQLFYRDAYDAEKLFGQLNKVLVSSIDLEFLLGQSSIVITDNLKADFCIFELNDEKSASRRQGAAKDTFNEHDATQIRHQISQLAQRVVVADYLEGDGEDIKHILDKNGVSALVSLTPNVRKPDEGLGYILLGPKKSGNPYSSQDIRVLDTIAGELIIAIQNALHFEEIQNFNVLLQRRIDEATRRLRLSNEKLKILDETKDDFISMASHQLRTPLTSVKGYVSMVMDGDVGKITATQRKLLNQAFTSSQRMVYLIADLLNVSRLKTGKFIIDPSPTNLATVIDEEISQLIETAQSRHLELVYHKPDSFPTLMLDETKIRQVIMNFIDNAIYYTQSNGHINVALVDMPMSIEFTVTDDGIGVPKAERHHLFNKFYRAGNARKARPDGTGLGLFMAQKVIVAQGGAIIFKSQEGKGSTFGFTFAKAALQPKPGGPAPHVQK